MEKFLLWKEKVILNLLTILQSERTRASLEQYHKWKTTLIIQAIFMIKLNKKCSVITNGETPPHKYIDDKNWLKEEAVILLKDILRECICWLYFYIKSSIS